jgi:hypothetical protein
VMPAALGTPRTRLAFPHREILISDFLIFYERNNEPMLIRHARRVSMSSALTKPVHSQPISCPSANLSSPRASMSTG